MISKNYLEELIKKSATIWAIGRYSFQNKIEEIKLDEDFFSVNNNALIYPDLFYTKLEDLFETEKEAKWALKHHATRIEELNLLTWEEFCKFDKLIPNFRFRFTDKDKENIALFLSDSLYGADPKNIVVYNFDGDCGFLFEELATEENYEKACVLCLKLFKGEK